MKSIEKILVSSCLLGENVRYHGGHALIISSFFTLWKSEGRIIGLCPEVAAGFSVPRPPSEIVGIGGGDSVLNETATVRKQDGMDYSEQFFLGANMALNLIQEHKIKLAILKEGSPSCGVNQIYDGTFSGKKVDGRGVTASYLLHHGVKVFSEYQINEAALFLTTLD